MDKIVAQRKKRHANREFAIDYLGGRCAECGSVNRSTLDFDHIDPATKIANISHLLSSARSTLLAELRKCQLLCRKCHDRKSLVEIGGPSEHGALRRYQHGCRCDLCRKNWNARARLDHYKARRRAGMKVRIFSKPRLHSGSALS